MEEKSIGEEATGADKVDSSWLYHAGHASHAEGGASGCIESFSIIFP
jgi:hypothetical protein